MNNSGRIEQLTQRGDMFTISNQGLVNKWPKTITQSPMNIKQIKNESHSIESNKFGQSLQLKQTLKSLNEKLKKVRDYHSAIDPTLIEASQNNYIGKKALENSSNGCIYQTTHNSPNNNMSKLFQYYQKLKQQGKSRAEDNKRSFNVSQVKI